MPTPSEQATTTLTMAIPTVDGDGNVVGWYLEAKMAFNGYEALRTHDVPEEKLASSKAPNRYTRAELLALCPAHRWNRMFDSQYNDVMQQRSQPVKRRLETFRAETLRES